MNRLARWHMIGIVSLSPATLTAQTASYDPAPAAGSTTPRSGTRPPGSSLSISGSTPPTSPATSCPPPGGCSRRWPATGSKARSSTRRPLGPAEPTSTPGYRSRRRRQGDRAGAPHGRGAGEGGRVAGGSVRRRDPGRRGLGTRRAGYEGPRDHPAHGDDRAQAGRCAAHARPGLRRQRRRGDRRARLATSSSGTTPTWCAVSSMSSPRAATPGWRTGGCAGSGSA